MNVTNPQLHIEFLAKGYKHEHLPSEDEEDEDRDSYSNDLETVLVTAYGVVSHMANEREH